MAGAEGKAEAKLAEGVIAKVVKTLTRDAEKPLARDAARAAERDAVRTTERDVEREGAGLVTREGDGLLAPGPHAGESIPARGPERDWTAQERRDIDRIGRDTGCHRCGATDPGTKGGHHVPDHQPPSQLNTAGDPQRLYPHCIRCSRKQGGTIAAMTKKVGLR